MKNQDIRAPTSTLNQTTFNQNNPNFTQQTPNVSVQNQIPYNKESNWAYQQGNLPSQGMQNADYGKSGETKNLQYLQSKYGQNDYQMGGNSYQSANMQNQGTNLTPNVGPMGQSVTIQPGYAATSNKVTGLDEWGRPTNIYERREG